MGIGRYGGWLCELENCRWNPESKDGRPFIIPFSDGGIRANATTILVMCLRQRFRHKLQTAKLRDCPSTLEPRVHRFTFEGQNSKDALVDPAQRFAADETFQGFDAEGKFAKREGSLAGDTAIAEPR